MRRLQCLVIVLLLPAAAPDAQARTVWRCLRDGTVSLATAPEPGSKCTAKELDDAAALLPNLWGTLGEFQGTLYQRQQDGQGSGERGGSAPRGNERTGAHGDLLEAAAPARG